MRLFLIIAAVTLSAGAIGVYVFRQYMAAKAMRGFAELFGFGPKKPPPPDPRRDEAKARVARLGSSSPLREFVILRREDEGNAVSDELFQAVRSRPRLEEEVAELLKAPDWPDRILGFETLGLVPTLSPELAAIAASTLRTFTRSLPRSVAVAERDLFAAANVFHTLRDHGFHDEAAAREFRSALRRHFGGRSDLDFIDGTVLECLDEKRGSSVPR
jgi:hypothetical protein